MRSRLPFGLIAGPLVALVVLLLPLPEGMSEAGRRTGAVTLLMACWWVTETVPIAVTALLPVFLFPLLAVLPVRETCAAYADRTNFFFFGGLVIASAVERWGLHRRLALLVLTRIGGSPRRVVLGFMTATALISMWASNTATTMLMLPIATAVLEHFERESRATHAVLAPALMLAIAYAASIGGVGTLVGTPPNVIFAGALTQLFPAAPPVGFGAWMLVGVPVVAVMIPLAWLHLTRVAFRVPRAATEDQAAVLERELARLGPMRPPERRVLWVFAATAFLWIFRADLDLGIGVVPGWARLLPDPAAVDDAVIAIAMATLLFLLPAGDGASRLLGGDWAERIPWGVLVLLGGGFALAAGVQSSGLAAWSAGHLGRLEELPAPVLALVVALLTAVISEFTLNSAVTALMMPILGAAAVGLALDPRLLMVPATLAASFTFMMPGGTAPNAMVFASGKLTVAQMARAGLGLKVVGLVVVIGAFFLLGVPGLGITTATPPPWLE